MGSRIELVRSRKGFYRDNYNRACIGLLIALVTILLLSALVVYLAAYHPVSAVYATSMDGQITRLASVAPPVRASAQ